MEILYSSPYIKYFIPILIFSIISSKLFKISSFVLFVFPKHISCVQLISNLLEVELGKLNICVDGINAVDDKIEFLDEFKIEENKYE